MSARKLKTTHLSIFELNKLIKIEYIFDTYAIIIFNLMKPKDLWGSLKKKIIKKNFHYYLFSVNDDDFFFCRVLIKVHDLFMINFKWFFISHRDFYKKFQYKKTTKNWDNFLKEDFFLSFS